MDNEEIEMLTEEEEKAIKSLERLAKKWPSTLFLFSFSGSLMVRKIHPKYPEEDRGRIVGYISGIANDGGDDDSCKEWGDGSV